MLQRLLTSRSCSPNACRRGNLSSVPGSVGDDGANPSGRRGRLPRDRGVHGYSGTRLEAPDLNSLRIDAARALGVR